MSTRFWLVRHASTAWTGIRYCGSTDLPLSRTGRREAVNLAGTISRWSEAVREIRSSPSQRALDTALAISNATGVEVAIDEELREVDFGRAEGLTWTQVAHRMPELAARVTTNGAFVDWPDGETAGELRARSKRVVERLIAAPGPLIVVSHGGIGRAILESAGVRTSDIVIAPAAVIEVRPAAVS